MEMTPATIQLFASGAAAAGSLVSGFSQAAASRRDAEIDDQNADLARGQAAARAAAIRRDAAKLKGAQRAAVGASGITMEGSPFDVMEDSAIEAELDALTATYEGKLQSRAYKVRGDSGRSDAKQSIFEGTTGAGAQALSGYGAWKAAIAAENYGAP